MATKIKILVRSDKTKKSPFHCTSVDTMPSDEVCVLFFGGNGTVDQLVPKKKFAEQIANGDAKRIQDEVISPHFDVDVPVYAVAYDFDNYGGELEVDHDVGNKKLEFNKQNLKRAFKNNILPLLSENGAQIDVAEIEHRWCPYMNILFATPEIEARFDRMLYDTLLELNYTDNQIESIEQMVKLRKRRADNSHITDLFNRIILPRITVDGKRRNLNDALIAMRKITFSAHCYGALLVRKLQDEMRKKMPTLGYSAKEVETILSQMLIVAHAPSGRLDKQTAAFYSFASAFDGAMLTPTNEIQQFIVDNKRTDQKHMIENNLRDMEHTWIPKTGSSMRAMFLPRNMGNMFIVPRGFDIDVDAENGYGDASEDEHGNTHFIKRPGQNKYGWLLNFIERNVLINGITNSLAQQEQYISLPDLQDLIQIPNSGPEQREHGAELFGQMQQNGKLFLKNVYANAIDKVRTKTKPAIKTKELNR